MSRYRSNGSSLAIDSRIVADLWTRRCKRGIIDLETMVPAPERGQSKGRRGTQSSYGRAEDVFCTHLISEFD